ncbi:MAG: hypothetical protein ACTSRS_18400 [Candidatus Helarchaeota archaeon]
MEKRWKRPDPAKELLINEISDREIDKNIKILGSIIEANPNYILLDDGTGQIQIVLNDDTKVSGEEILEVGALVRAFGICNKVEGKFLLSGKIIQDMRGLDLELYQRVREVKRRFEKNLK